MTVSIIPVALVGAACLFCTAAGYPRYAPVRPSYLAPNEGYGAPPLQQQQTFIKPNCGPGLVLKVDGSCARPLINRNIFLYQSPQVEINYGPPPSIPDPMIDYNYVFIKAPSSVVGPEPIVVPPPQQKTLVYVLSEEPKLQTQPIIEVPTDVTEPEVFFINYKDGDNPTLPGGIDLRTALSQSAHSSLPLGGGGGGGFSAPQPNYPAPAPYSGPSAQYGAPVQIDDASITAGIGTFVNGGNKGFRLDNLIGEQLQPTEVGSSVFVNGQNQQGSSYV